MDSGAQIIRRFRPKRVFLAVLSFVCAEVLALGLWGLNPIQPPPLVRLDPVDRDLPAIRASGVLRVAVPADEMSTAPRQGRGEGIASDLVQRLAQRWGADVEVVVPHQEAAAFRALLRGEVDIVAAADSGSVPLAIDRVAWTSPLSSARPVVVGRHAKGIRSLADLRDAAIAVRSHSALEQTAEGWRGQLGGDVRIIRVPADWTMRQLAFAASRGTYPLVLMDEPRARLESAIDTQLERSAPLDQPLPVRWAVRTNAPALLADVSTFLEQSRSAGLVAEVERRYLENPSRFARLPDARTLLASLTQLTPWDGLFREAAQRNGLDWRLLAAIAFQESRFDPWGVGEGGSAGLLQLMPDTAKEFGADDPFDPAQNLAAGSRHLHWLAEQFSDIDEPERLPFTLAAFNMGLGHIEDARQLAIQRGLLPNRWDGNVAQVLPLLEDAQVAAQLAHGQARGRSTLAYVEKVRSHYQRFLAGETPHDIDRAALRTEQTLR